MTINQLSSGKERIRLLQRSLQDCCQDGQLSNEIIAMLKENRCNEILRSVFKYDGSIETLKVKDLPKEWSQKGRRSFMEKKSMKTA